MKKSDVTCRECGAWFRRIELTSERGVEGQYRCPACGAVLERFDGHNLVAYRLTVPPSIRTPVGQRAAPWPSGALGRQRLQPTRTLVASDAPLHSSGI
jgi:hypothetical protein